MKKIKLTDLLIFIVTAELVGALSALFAGSYSSFYKALEHPPLSPPSWLFPVVWAILYAVMGISAYMIWRNHDNELRRSSALKLYYFQLGVNFLWSIVFFRFNLLCPAAAIAVLLLALVVLMVLTFFKLKPAAGWLNIPYVIWLAFASYLAIGIYLLN